MEVPDFHHGGGMTRSPKRAWKASRVMLLLLVTAALWSLSSSSSPKAPKSSPSERGQGGDEEEGEKKEEEEKRRSKCGRPCGNGRCDEEAGVCLCNPGWRGPDCSQCGGKVRLDGEEGWLADAVGNYSVDTRCTWLIEAPEGRRRIRLHLKDFATECGWDHLYVFDGDSVFSELRAVFSGMILQDSYRVHRVPELVGHSGSVLLHFYSDVAYNMTGFNVTFGVDDCPSEHHAKTCSGHGECDRDSGRCLCDPEFVGPACARPACPNRCRDSQGQSHGTCLLPEEQRCRCDPGWEGESCSQPAWRGFWRVLSPNLPPSEPVPGLEEEDEEGGGGEGSSSSVATQRTSHAAMVDDFDRMWVVGGETFTSRTRHMVAMYEEGRWSEVHAKSDKGPTSRYGHSAVIHDQKIYMYGGTMRSGHTSRELWSLDLDLLVWERVKTKPGQCLGVDQGGRTHSKLCGPVHSMGHSANVFSNRMIVIFGHSPKYGYLNTVQEYHFGNKEWSIVPTKGYHVRGGLGHSSVYDEGTNLIYVYGGYVSTMSTTAAISNELYSFDPTSRIWRRHSSSPSYRYLHSAVVLHGVMLVFGGNTHNDTSFSQGAKCYSADFSMYDIRCDRWLPANDRVPKALDADLARFGHSAVVLNGTMLVHGGFHGLLRNDLLAFAPGDCEYFKSREECLAAKVGVKCAYDAKKGTCVRLTVAVSAGAAAAASVSANSGAAKSGLDVCGNVRPANHTETCAAIKSCTSCVSTTFDCVWCGERSCRWRGCGAVGDLADGGRREGESDIASSPSPRVLSSSKLVVKELRTLDQCTESGQRSTPSEWCKSLHTCHSCAVHQGCRWERDKISRCREVRRDRTRHRQQSKRGGEKDERAKSDGDEGNLTEETETGLGATCGISCSERPDCRNCTQATCMWCLNLNTCIDRNAYLASFPYGQCMDWTTEHKDCPAPPSDRAKNQSLPEDMCTGHSTCESCRSNPACGWCDDGSLTGLGVCLPGGASGPFRHHRTSVHSRGEWRPDQSLCPARPPDGRLLHGRSWHFTDCPACQCHGHSNCSLSPGGDVCGQPCQHHTEGEHCQRCAEGFYGDAVNGGSCQGCKCNGNAARCDHRSGRCHCTTKGIVGDHCEKCDKVNHYYGDPVKDSCFYELAIDYQFTFNLSKVDDRHFTAINFKNTPTRMDVDVDFQVHCSMPAKLNLTYRSSGDPSVEHAILSEHNCSEVTKKRFSKDKFPFGGDSDNTTFYIYVYDFQPPLWIVISFSQHPKLDLLQFFITFSICFLALLLVAAVLWKIKQRYDRYRRRQRLFVEMEQMASRPFGSVLVELERIPETSTSTSTAATAAVASVTSQQQQQQQQHQVQNSASSVSVSSIPGVSTTPTGAGSPAALASASASAEDAVVSLAQPSSSSSSSSGVRKRKKRGYRPSPIALEPCEGNRAAVLSLIVRLPTGGKQYAPPGYTGIAVASSLVTLGNQRKPSSEISSKVEDPKSRKGRKGPNAQPADI